MLALFLLSGGLAVSGHDIGRHPAALLDVDALVLGPGADRVRVDGARVPPGAAADPARAAVKRAVRSGPITALTRPAVATVLYCAVVIGTHTPPFMDLVLENEAVHEAEHALYLLAGCLFFPRGCSAPNRSATEYRRFGAFPHAADHHALRQRHRRRLHLPVPRGVRPVHEGRPRLGPSLVNDLHGGGYIMIFGSNAVMSIIAITLAARSFRSASGSMLPGGSRGHANTGSDARLGAYNEYLRRLDSHADAYPGQVRSGWLAGPPLARQFSIANPPGSQAEWAMSSSRMKTARGALLPCSRDRGPAFLPPG